MAGIAGLADDRDRGLQAVERRFCLVAVFRHRLAEGGGLSVEIVLVQPDLRCRARVAAGLGIVGKQARSFCAVSAHCTKAASTLAASNAAWPRIICTTAFALSLLCFMSD